MKKHAFTLAETLITLTIIGVIAALTIPTLISKYQKHTYVVGLKRAYAQIQHAAKMIPITEGCSGGDYECAGFGPEDKSSIEGLTFYDPLNKQLYLLSKNLKTKTICLFYTTKDGKRFIPSEEECKKITIDPRGEIVSAIQLEDGTIIDHNGAIDINGLKGPNKYGRDRFNIEIAKETRNGVQVGTVMPFGSKIYGEYRNNLSWWWNYSTFTRSKCTQEKVNTQTTIHYDLWYCAGRIFEEGAMNY